MTSVPRRVGVTVPIPGARLHEHREWYEEIAALGYTDVWSGEANGADGLTPLILAAAWEPRLRVLPPRVLCRTFRQMTWCAAFDAKLLLPIAVALAVLRRAFRDIGARGQSRRGASPSQ